MKSNTPSARKQGDSGDDFTEVEAAPPFDPTDQLADVTDRGAADVTISSVAPAPARAHSGPFDDAEIAPGAMLGDYRVEGQIGQGGMGIVLSAIHPLIGKRAAIKVLKAALCTDPYSIERFVDEARVVNQIGHPNIVDVFTFGQTRDGRSYLVMEWLKGESLRERLARERMSLAEVCRVMRPLVRALTAAHDCGVIHRDLKPDNVFLVEVSGEPSHVKLLDFGIAKLAHEDHRMEKTASGALVGTPLYVAPEQAKGVSIDQRADIYALGGMLFELVTGRPPFLANSALEVIAKHLMEMPARASTLARVPAELDDLILRMLAKEPIDRPTLVEVSGVLEHVARTTSPLVAIERDSYHSIAVTSRRAVSTPAEDPRAVTAPPTAAALAPRTTTRRLAIWALPLIAIVGAVAAYAIVNALGRDEHGSQSVPTTGAPVMAIVSDAGTATAPPQPRTPTQVQVTPIDPQPQIATPTPTPTPTPIDPQQQIATPTPTPTHPKSPHPGKPRPVAPTAPPPPPPTTIAPPPTTVVPPTTAPTVTTKPTAPSSDEELLQRGSTARPR